MRLQNTKHINYPAGFITLYITFHFSQYEHGIHRSNAEVLVEKVPPKEVDGTMAICDGGGGALGHPLEYIQLDTVSSKPAVCKYCGVRFVMAHH